MHGPMNAWFATGTAKKCKPETCKLEYSTSIRSQRKNVNRKNVNSSTVLVSGYEYERVEDRLPMCRGVCRGV